DVGEEAAMAAGGEPARRGRVSMNRTGGMGQPGPPPFARLRDRLLEEAATLEHAGQAQAAGSLRALTEAWWAEQESWNARVRDALGVHHEINNALVGVRGNTQLMLMDSSGPGPDARERLEVVL